MSNGDFTLTAEVREMLMKRLADLDREQESLNQRRAEAKALLATLKVREQGAPTRQPPDTTKAASISSLIIRAIAEKPGATAADVVAAVHGVRPSVSGKVIHAILYRLRAVDRKISNKGERGAMTYYVASAQSPKKPERPPRRSSPPYKALAQRFLVGTPGRHSVAAVASAIDCRNLDQVRNILVRLTNAGTIRRISEGVYEANLKESAVPSG